MIEFYLWTKDGWNWMRGISLALIACALGGLLNGRAADASGERVLYDFCSVANCTDGEFPSGGVVAVDGTLFGTTYVGGSADGGTVFALDLKTRTESAVHSFGSGHDGALPLTGVIDVDGILYGTTPDGGSGACTVNGTWFGCGTVFSIDSKTGAEKVVYSFQDNYADGVDPEAGLINVNGKLYGTTSLGGRGGGCYSVYYGCGTVFSIDLETGEENVVYSFRGNGADGTFPEVGRLIDINGTLYGTTPFGGAESCACGTVFSLDPATGSEMVLHSFSGSPDGMEPFAGMIEVHGRLYGTTEHGGTGCPDNGFPGCGTVFRLDPTTRKETVVYSFNPQQDRTDGATPAAGVLDVHGTLYGTTSQGGIYSQGTAFSLDLKNTTETVLFSFHRKHGNGPSSLTHSNGRLYGTAFGGGAVNSGACAEYSGHGGCGVVFSIVP